MGKKKKQARVGNGDESKSGGKASNGGNKLRRSKRTRRPVETNEVDDYKFRQSVEDGARIIMNIEADGNCLFGSLSDQLYYDLGNSHSEIRHDVCDFIEAMESEFTGFLVLDDEDEDATDFESYIRSMREDGEWGGNLELVAAARLYRRNIIVFSTDNAITIDHGQSDSGGPDIMVSYHGAEHYNSVRSKTAKRPPPPTKTTFPKTKQITVTESEGDETELVLESGQDDMDVDAEEAKEDLAMQHVEPPPKPPKKNDPCPCGSNFRYKKCCLPVEKSKRQTEKWKAAKTSGTGNSDDNPMNGDNEESEHQMDGTFRVLKI